MPAPSTAPLLKRSAILRCRLSTAQQRIRELETLLADHGITIPATATEVYPIDHDCFPGY